MPNKNCTICNKPFWTRSTKKYCSINCHDIARRARENKRYKDNPLSKEISLKRYYKNKKQITKRRKEWYLENRSTILEQKKKLYKENIEKFREQGRKKIKESKYIESRKKYLEKRLKEDPNYLRKFYKNYKKKKIKNNDLNWILARLNRSRLSNALISQEAFKNKKYSSFKYLGCTLKELKKYLELKFKPGMTWKNRGKNGWHIDHIKPVSSYNLKVPGEIEKCFHYTNLQPLWAEENLKKGDKY